MKSQSNEVIDLSVEFPKPLQQPSCTLSNKVSFATYSLVIMPNEKLAHYANTPTSDLWYTQSDIQSFKKEKAYTIRTIRTGSTIEKLSSCNTCVFLGLESYLFGSAAGHRGGPVQRRKEIRTAVLLEQIRQDNLSIHKDPAELARVSERTSSLCRQRAQIIGLIHSS